MGDAPLIDIRGLPQILHNCRAKTFPDGSSEIMVPDRAIFREPGWSESDDRAAARAKLLKEQRKDRAGELELTRIPPDARVCRFAGDPRRLRTTA